MRGAPERPCILSALRLVLVVVLVVVVVVVPFSQWARSGVVFVALRVFLWGVLMLVM